MDQINISLFTSELWPGSGSWGKCGERMLTDPDRISNLTEPRTIPPHHHHHPPQGFYPLGHVLFARWAPGPVCPNIPHPQTQLWSILPLRRVWVFLNFCWWYLWSCKGLHWASSMPEGHKCRGLDASQSERRDYWAAFHTKCKMP